MTDQQSGPRTYRTYCQSQSIGATIHIAARDNPVVELRQDGETAVVTVTPTQFSFSDESISFEVTPDRDAVSFDEGRVVSHVEGVRIVQKDPDTDRIYVGNESDGWVSIGEFDYSGDPVLFRSQFDTSDSVPGLVVIET